MKPTAGAGVSFRGFIVGYIKNNDGVLISPKNAIALGKNAQKEKKKKVRYAKAMHVIN